MKVSLVVNRITEDIEENFTRIVNAINKYSDETDLFLFPEGAITGLINNDDPSHDLPIASPIPGRYTRILSHVAKERSVHIGIGMLERDGYKLYDSAILINSFGEIALHYRRITPTWHGKNADPKVYCEGTELKKVKTNLGTFAFLICGDLFDDSLIGKIRKLQIDYLLYPFSRCFKDGTYNQERWEDEKHEYIKRIKLAKSTTLMVNTLAHKALDGGSFGGAMIVSSSGEIIKEIPIGKEGILHAEI